jgi:Kef-type K+ transport system membrane component KefB
MATGGVRAGHVTLSVVTVIGVLVLAVTVARPIADTVLKLAARSKEPNVSVAAAVVLLLLCAAATQALRLEAVLGALLGGMLIGSSATVDRERLSALSGFALAVLAPLFFVTAGLRMDLTTLRRPEVLGSAIVVLLVAVAGKFAGVYLGARAARLGHWDALALGAGLNARGVIEVIIAGVGLRLGVLTTQMYTIVILVAIATSLMAPPLLRFAVRRIEVTREETEREWTLVGG